MKKMFAITALCLCFAFFPAACGTPEKKEIPEMQLEYTVNGIVHRADATRTIASWSFEDRTQVETEALHPLVMAGKGYMTEIEKSGDLKNLRILFTVTPDSYTVRRWEDIYVSDSGIYEYEHLFEEVNVSDNTIVLSDDYKGYIYEIKAIWPQGSVYYTFYVKQ